MYHESYNEIKAGNGSLSIAHNASDVKLHKNCRNGSSSETAFVHVEL